MKGHKNLVLGQGNFPRDSEAKKLSWEGKIVSIQPRIRLLRSFDQRNHSYLGYALRVNGMIGDEQGEFLVGIGKGKAYVSSG
jgi:hypothetical protein